MLYSGTSPEPHVRAPADAAKLLCTTMPPRAGDGMKSVFLRNRQGRAHKAAWKSPATCYEPAYMYDHSSASVSETSRSASSSNHLQTRQRHVPGS